MFGIWTRIPPGWLRLWPTAVAATCPSMPIRLIEYVAPPSMMKSCTTTPSGSRAFAVGEGDGPLAAMGEALVVAVDEAVGLGFDPLGPAPQPTTRTINAGAAHRI